MDSENNPHTRKADRCLIFRVWEMIYPYWHIGSTVSGFLIAFAFAVWWVRDVSAYQQITQDTFVKQDERITKLETVNLELAEIRGELSAIRQFMGAPAPKKPPKEPR